MKTCLAALLLSAASAHAAPADLHALMAPVNRLVAAINGAALSCPDAVFSADSIVIDDFPPFRWSKPGSGCDWYQDLRGRDAKTQVDFMALHAALSVGAPLSVQETGDAAYLVLPGSFLFDGDGKRTHQTATWLMIEQKTASGWRIAGHAWAITAEEKR